MTWVSSHQTNPFRSSSLSAEGFQEEYRRSRNPKLLLPKNPWNQREWKLFPRKAMKMIFLMKFLRHPEAIGCQKSNVVKSDRLPWAPSENVKPSTLYGGGLYTLWSLIIDIIIGWTGIWVPRPNRLFPSAPKIWGGAKWKFWFRGCNSFLFPLPLPREYFCTEELCPRFFGRWGYSPRVLKKSITGRQKLRRKRSPLWIKAEFPMRNLEILCWETFPSFPAEVSPPSAAAGQ